MLALSAVWAGQHRLADVADQIAVRRFVDGGVATAGIAGIKLFPVFLSSKFAGLGMENEECGTKTPSIN
jgi:hypothetical protein